MKRNKIEIMAGLLLLGLCSGCAKNNNGGEDLSESQTTVDQTQENSEVDESETQQQEEETISEEEEMKEEELNTILPTADNVKLLGRTYEYNDAIWCALSASGIEFQVTGKQCDITIAGDNMASFTSGKEHYARIGIYVDDELVVDDFISSAQMTFTAYQSEEEKTATIRVIKLSESSDSTIGIKEIQTDADTITPTAEKDIKIEYIGDSITCGYGVDGVLGDTYATSNENATKAYAYLSAQAVDADYSLVSFSGYGIISGWTGDGTIQDQQIVPNYYTKLGNSYGKFAWEVAPNTVDWDFSQFVPDIIVINLGTNDASYCGSDEERCAVFQQQYTEFIKQVRENNANATILCTLGVMGDDLFSYIEAAVADYTEQTGDTNIQTMHFSAQNADAGYAVDYHPCASNQQKAADELTETLKTLIAQKQEEAKNFSYEELDTGWIDTSKKLVAFAFDDGPVSWSENSTAMQILKTLEENGQHATFFYIGQNINESSKQEIQYAKQIGCEIGNHTWTHPYLTQLTEEEVKEEVEKTRAKLEEITGISSFLLRLPYLNYNQKVLDEVNVPCISCSVDTQDWNNGTYDSVVERMLSAEENGTLENAIILMHEHYSYTAEAVAYLVPYLLDNGYQIVSVSELAAVKGITLEAGNVYTSIQ